MIAEDLQAFLSDKAERNKPATAEFYSSRSKWIDRNLGASNWGDISPQRVLSAFDGANRWPSGKHKQPDTQRGNAIAWEQFQVWALETGRISEPITKPLPKPPGRIRNIIPTLDDVRRILDSARPDFAAVYRALLLTGARPGELCRATVADYDQPSGVICLQDHKTAGKTGKPRVIPVSAHCQQVIADSLGERTAGPIFLRRCGRGWTPGTLSQAFRRLRDALGMDRHLVLYCTRHKFATELCHAQGIEAAAAVLGHSGLQTIRRYVHHDNEQLRRYAEGVDAGNLIPVS